MRRTKPTSYAIGAGFEKSFEDMALMRGWSVVRIPNGCRRISKFNLIPVKTPFDYIIAKEGKAVFLDCKCFSHNTVTNSDINENQMNQLMSLEREGHRAGYLVYFVKTCKLVWFDASKLFECRPGNGLQQEQGLMLGDLITMNLNLLHA